MKKAVVSNHESALTQTDNSRMRADALAAVDLERVSVDGMEFPPRNDQRVQLFHPATASRLTLR